MLRKVWLSWIGVASGRFREKGIVKNKYFGDTRDLFKYNLIFEIIREIDSINRFTFIPMLTKNKNGIGGNETDYSNAKAGTENGELVRFLRRCVEEKRRNVTEIKEFFQSKGIEIEIYKETEYFDAANRAGYFKSVPDELLYQSLIFLDPDNGLEIKDSGEKHVLYSEVKDLFERMTGGSILMVYQHFPREEHRQYIRKRANELKEKVGNWPLYISDDQIVFFLLTKEESVRSHLYRILQKYNERHPKLYAGSIES